MGSTNFPAVLLLRESDSCWRQRTVSDNNFIKHGSIMVFNPGFLVEILEHITIFFTLVSSQL